MLIAPHINPVAITLGPLKVHWYGIMYLCGFLFYLYGGRYRLKKYGHSFLTTKLIDDSLFYMALGVIIGGRLGFCLFYQPWHYLNNPIDIIKTWNGGMSFHGGLIGVMVAMYLFTHKHQRNFFELADFTATLVPMGLFFGRIGNFINGELWGRIAPINFPLGLIYPQSGSMLPRFPSQLFEACGEGLLLFVIIWCFAAKPRKLAQVSGLFVIGYGLIRFVLEYFREPDGYLLWLQQNTGLSMGQWLCIPMLIFGLVLYIYPTSNKHSNL